MRPPHTCRWVSLLAPVVLAGCNDPVGARPGIAGLQVVAGDAQIRVAGKPVRVRPTVQAVDARGAGIPGIAITFVASRGGSVEPAVVFTDQQGRAAPASWVLRPDGVEDTLLAVTESGDTARFSGTALLFTEISAGSSASCGTTNMGLAFCWGFNGNGRLGVGDTTIRLAPTLVRGPVRYTKFLAGNYGNCGLGRDGQAYCAGALIPVQGMQPPGDLVPTPQPGGLRFTDLALPELGPVCGLAEDQKIYCWGATSGLPRAPLAIPDQLGSGFVEISAAGGAIGVPEPSNQVCGITRLGEVACYDLWALGSRTQAPFTVTAVAQVAETNRGVCTRNAAGAVLCHGPYYPVAGSLALVMPPATDIEGGLFTTCGATVNGVHCWDLFNPVVTLVPGTEGRRWRKVTVGAGHSCALDDTGMPWCWGENGAGQLGDGSTTSRTTPVRALLDY